jgi:[NiFe] hydrogenase diaphorase moiety small subunit
MSDIITFTIDGVEVTAKKGQTILQAADDAGIYIPRLCYVKQLKPGASCRLCTVMINGRPVAACTQPAADGMVVQSETEQLNAFRKSLVEMMLVEGNHFCMFCEKSGNCELQGMAYRFGIPAPKYPYLFPKRQLDASHPEVFIDGNRCIQCGRCIRASRELDGKNVFQYVGRGGHKRVGVNAEGGLSGSEMAGSDGAAGICPVGAIIKKRVGFAVPVGKRLYDHEPIGSEIEARSRRGGKK